MHRNNINSQSYVDFIWEKKKTCMFLVGGKNLHTHFSYLFVSYFVFQFCFDVFVKYSECDKWRKRPDKINCIQSQSVVAFVEFLLHFSSVIKCFGLILFYGQFNIACRRFQNNNNSSEKKSEMNLFDHITLKYWVNWRKLCPLTDNFSRVDA